MDKSNKFLKIIFILSVFSISTSVACSSVSVKFEDDVIDIEYLTCASKNLLPLHVVAPHCSIEFKWLPELEQMILSKDGAQVKIALGNQYALVKTGTTNFPFILSPLSIPPTLVSGSVALPPRDVVTILSDLLTDMNVLWDEQKGTIEAKKRSYGILDESRAEMERIQRNGTFELKTIIIDPGHGGYDPGASGKGVREKHIVLDIAKRLTQLIESKSDWNVVLTRDNDKYINLQKRADIANQYPADSTLFISIHCNADSSKRGRGLETYVFNMEASDAEAAALAKRENAQERMDLAYILSHCYHVGNEPYSLEAARKIQTSLVSYLKLRNRGIKRAPFYVLAGTKMPAILVEIGFISNYYDRQKLQTESFRQKTAEALLEAIEEFNRATGKKLAKANLR
jgi:N-acetylmuramoyl-L-alanine amidase